MIKKEARAIAVAKYQELQKQYGKGLDGYDGTYFYDLPADSDGPTRFETGAFKDGDEVEIHRYDYTDGRGHFRWRK